jgi:hypothetical protein
MLGSLSVANTVVSPADVVGVDYVEVGRSAAHSRYNSGPSTLGYTHIDWGEFCVLGFNFLEKVSAMQIGFE